MDAKKYWNSVRRALLRAKIDRIGLGGYLHLVEGFPDFCDYIEKVADEFRLIRSFHDAGRTLPHQDPCGSAALLGKLTFLDLVRTLS
ncbi:MAG: 1,3-beta-galactosyl-N-acetylhexosamine phosphorylase N-terminal domain-containing protein [Waltera sp.]